MPFGAAYIALIVVAVMFGAILDIGKTFMDKMFLQAATHAATLAASSQSTPRITGLNAYGEPISSDIFLKSDSSPETEGLIAWNKNMESLPGNPGMGSIPVISRLPDNKTVQSTVTVRVENTFSAASTRMWMSAPHVQSWDVSVKSTSIAER